MKKTKNHIDRISFFIVLLFMVMSTIIVYSASSTIALQKFGSSSSLVSKHVVKILLGIVVMLVAINIDYKFYKKFTKGALIASLFALMVTLLLGGEVKGASRWLNFFGLSIQPSEFAKYFLIFHLSNLMATKGEKINDLKFGYMPLLLWILSVVVLVMLQPNFSMGGVILIISILFLFLLGANFLHLFNTFMLSLPLLFIYIIIAPYRMKRVLAFLGMGSENAVNSTNYQLNQGLIAIGSGGIIGIGMGESRQRDLFLPEAYGDFIFSIIGEEYGFVGAVILLALYLFLFLRGMKISYHIKDEFGKNLAIGISLLVVVYALANIFVAIGFAPTTGLPMPFISYGGTAIILTSFAVGVLLNISSQTDLFPREYSIEKVPISDEQQISKVYS